MVALLVTLFLFGTVTVHAELTANSYVDLNGDCVNDTLMGEQLAGGKFVLREVRWGSRIAGSHCDTNYYKDTLLAFHSKTAVRLPIRDYLSTGISILKYNQDDAHDLLIQVAWSTDTSQTGRSRARRADSSFSFVIPAQRGIDTLDTLVIDKFNGTKRTPIVMRSIRQADGADSVAKIGSLFTVRQLKRKNIQVDLEDAVAGQLVLDVEKKSEHELIQPNSLVLNVYPNPLSGEDVNVAISNLRGRGELALYDGMCQLVATVPINESTGLHTHLPLQIAHLPSGAYRFVLIENAGRIAVAHLVINR